MPVNDGLWRGRDSGRAFFVPPHKAKPLPPEQSIKFWHPQRFGVQLAPAEFMHKLHAIHPDLSCTWNPIIGRWLVWYKRPRITHPMCKGWLLLFIVEDEQTRFIPLDERVLAACWQCSANFDGNWGGSLPYVDRIMKEKERERRAAKKQTDDYRERRGSDHWDYTLIKNIGHGSKFANHHAGD